MRDVNGLAAAMRGVRTVVSVMSGYGPNSGGDPRSVDGAGNSNLIRAAESAGVEHFVLVSVQGAGPRHPMELMRMKFMAEQELKASRLAWTIIRPTAFIETWAQIAGKGIVFGRGDNPINFVSACDVAQVVERAVTDRALRGVELEVGGPEDLTLRQFAANFTAGHRRIPRPAMRLMSVLARPINPSMARLAHGAVVMDTFDLKLDRSGNNNHTVIVGTTTVAAVAREIGQRVQ